MSSHATVPAVLAGGWATRTATHRCATRATRTATITVPGGLRSRSARTHPMTDEAAALGGFDVSGRPKTPSRAPHTSPRLRATQQRMQSPSSPRTTPPPAATLPPPASTFGKPAPPVRLREENHLRRDLSGNDSGSSEEEGFAKRYSLSVPRTLRLASIDQLPCRPLFSPSVQKPLPDAVSGPEAPMPRVQRTNSVGTDVSADDEGVANDGGLVERERQMKADMEYLKERRVVKFSEGCNLDLSKVDAGIEVELIDAIHCANLAKVYGMLRRHVDDKRLLLTCDSLCAAVAIENPMLIKTMLLYPLADFASRARAPVCDAVLLQNVKIVRLLLLGPISDVNLFMPLAQAVEMRNVELVDTLLKCPRINCNRGGALYRAISLNEPKIVRMLLSEDRMQVNKVCKGAASTPLCRAIDLQRTDMIEMLLRHPKIDINAGFLLTPLQQAIDTRDVAIVQLVLDASTRTELDVNRCIGNSPHPFAMAIASPNGNDNAREIAQLLLAHPRTCITTELCDDLTLHHPEFEDLVCKSGRVHASVSDELLDELVKLIIGFALLFSTSIGAAFCTLFAGNAGLWSYTIPVLALWLLLPAVAYYVQVNNPRYNQRLLWLRFVPLCVYEILVAVWLYKSVNGGRPTLRRIFVRTADFNLRLYLTYFCVPVLLLTFFVDWWEAVPDSTQGQLFQEVRYPSLALSLIASVAVLGYRVYEVIAHRDHAQDAPGLVVTKDVEMKRKVSDSDSFRPLQSRGTDISVTVPDFAPAGRFASSMSSQSGSGLSGRCHSRNLTPDIFLPPGEGRRDTTHERANRVERAVAITNNRPRALDLDVIKKYSSNQRLRLPNRAEVDVAKANAVGR